MAKSRLQYGDSSIEVHHQGAHLSSWLYQGEEQLFLSRKMRAQATNPIRGGVPICFPQFGAFGPGQKHGFARNVNWQKCDTDQANLLHFELSHNPNTLSLWPHEFKAQFTLELEQNTLTMTIDVKNTGAGLIEFTAALHSYFYVHTIKQAVVDGLESCEFWDNGHPFSQRSHQIQTQLHIDKMIDRVYFNTQNPLRLIQPQSTRIIESHGFFDTVIWNPWREGAGALADMDEDEYRKMLCIESANMQTPIRLAPSATWRGVQKIAVLNN